MASSPFRLSIPALSFVSALVLLALAALPAGAQTVVGTVPRPAVTVDLSVLDSLGPEPTLPDLLRGRTPPGARTAARPARRTRTGGIILHRPKAEKKQALAKAAPKSETKAVAAQPAATTAAAAPRESVAATPLAEPPPSPPAAPQAAVPAATPPPTTATAPTSPASAASANSAPAAAAGSPPVAAPAKQTAAAPTMPTVAPPSPAPMAPPTPAAAVTAMNAPPSLPPAAPVKPTPAAAPAAVAAAGQPPRILFSGAGADLPDGAKGVLDAMAQRLAGDAHLRLQLVAYASGTADQANQARRVSLQRALAVRSYLMEHGVANTRMDVRALGNHNEGDDPPDRVDIVLLEH